MSPAPAKLSVFVSGPAAFIKIAGRANFTSSLDFKTLFNELSAQGCTCFLLDLGECVLMDSTFLGVLAGFGLRLSHTPEGQPARLIELLNPNVRVAELLENLGVLHLFNVVTGPKLPPAQAESREPQAPEAPTHEEVTRNCLEAHKTLMQISEANIPRFKDVTQFLAEELQRHKPAK